MVLSLCLLFCLLGVVHGFQIFDFVLMLLGTCYLLVFTLCGVLIGGCLYLIWG